MKLITFRNALTAVFTWVMCSFSYSQIEYSTASVDFNTDQLIEPYSLFSTDNDVLNTTSYSHVLSGDKISNAFRSIETSEDELSFLIADYDANVMAGIGVYLNPHDESVKFKGKEAIRYKSIQVTDSKTRKTVLRTPIDPPNNLIDISSLSLQTGTYQLILIDKNNRVYSEDFSIYRR